MKISVINFPPENCIDLIARNNIITYVISEGENIDMNFIAKVNSLVNKCESTCKKYLLIDARNYFSVTGDLGQRAYVVKAIDKIDAVAIVFKELGSLVKLHELVIAFQSSVPIKYFIEEKYALDWFRSIQQ
jgi:hypothetical protein